MSDPASVLRLVSYNVHGCLGLVRRRHIGRVAAVIRRLDADLVAVQEVDGRDADGQLDALARATAMLPIAGPTIRTERGDYGNALLTRVEAERVECCDLSFAGREPRGLVDATFRHEGHTVRVLATHFGLDWRERAAQTDIVLDRLADPSADVVVLLGDINEWRPRASVVRRIGELMGAAPSPGTFPSLWPILALDRIWVKPAGALVSLRVVGGLLERVASDHLPLVAEIRLG